MFLKYLRLTKILSLIDKNNIQLQNRDFLQFDSVM